MHSRVSQPTAWSRPIKLILFVRWGINNSRVTRNNPSGVLQNSVVGSFMSKTADKVSVHYLIISANLNGLNWNTGSRISDNLKFMWSGMEEMC